MTFGMMDRRRFLKLAGLGAGVAVGGPTAVGVERWLTGSRNALKLGVMLPSGSRYPAMTDHLMAGMRLGFERARAAGSGLQPSFATAEVVRGYGGARTALEVLLDREKADVVVAGISAPVARRLGAMLAERHVPMVVANVGAHVVAPHDRNPYVLHNSLNYWQASFAMGTWAAGNLGRRALVVTSAADAGYDTIYAFTRGMEVAGGKVVDVVVMPGDDEGTVRTLTRAARSTRPDFVYALFSGEDAASFLRAYRQAGLRLPLAGTGFMVDRATLGSNVRSALGVTTCMPGTGREADPFATLGFDTASLLVAGMERANRRGLGASGLVRALSGVTVPTARGELTVDARTNTVVGPLFIQRVVPNGLGAAPENVDAPAAVGAFPPAMAGLERSRSTYLNEYLCQ
jgi:ABC-type branched-subunit amino acid transport system substrate-binding protein